MTSVRFSKAEKEELKEFNDPDIPSKLFIFGIIKRSVQNLLKDYLGNEESAMHYGASLPKERIREYEGVCDILKSKTVREVLSMLEDYNPRRIMPTDYNREYLLKKFGLWTEELENGKLKI